MRLIDAEHLKWNVGGIKCGTLTVAYLNWILEHEEPTVEAIPIEYINNQIGRWERSKCESYHAICYRHLIEEWKMENERKEE